MTQRLEVLWHREIGDRLLVALEEEPVVQCENHSFDKIHYHRQQHANGPFPSIPMPSGTRVELVQTCWACKQFADTREVLLGRVCHVCNIYSDDFFNPGVIPLGVATLEEVVPWEDVRIDPLPDEPPIPLPSTLPAHIVNELAPVEPKYVALCEVVS